VKAYPKRALIGTLSYMPAVFDFAVASVAMRHILGEKY